MQSFLEHSDNMPEDPNRKNYPDPYAIAPGVSHTVEPDEKLTSLQWFAYIGELIKADQERRGRI